MGSSLSRLYVEENENPAIDMDFGRWQSSNVIIKLIIFAVGSLVIVFLSWKSLRHLSSHGFFRFLVFESISALVLLNIEYWFRHPFSALQIVSWLLLLASLILVSYGFYMLRMFGRPKGGIDD